MTKLRRASRGYHEVLFPAPHSRYVRGRSCSSVFASSSNLQRGAKCQSRDQQATGSTLAEYASGHIMGQTVVCTVAHAGRSLAERSSTSLAVSVFRRVVRVLTSACDLPPLL